MYNGPIIRSYPVKINKGMRRKIHIPMIMDEMKGRVNRLSTRGRARSSKTRFRLAAYLCFIIIFIRIIEF
jgi:hypothetical protein